jgi:hypothetical protein
MVGRFHISPDEQTITVYPEPGVTHEVLGLMLVGQIAIFLLLRRGIPTLHASAVVTDAGALGFLGRKGSGSPR